jgi:hypothetical protein
MCECSFVVMLLSTFFVMGLMCGGIVLLIQAGSLQQDQEFNAPFHSHSRVALHRRGLQGCRRHDGRALRKLRL